MKCAIFLIKLGYLHTYSRLSPHSFRNTDNIARTSECLISLGRTHKLVLCRDISRNHEYYIAKSLFIASCALNLHCVATSYV